MVRKAWPVSPSSIYDVSVASNGIGEEGAQALVRALDYNTKLRDFDLDGNDAILPTTLGLIKYLISKRNGDIPRAVIRAARCLSELRQDASSYFSWLCKNVVNLISIRVEASKCDSRWIAAFSNPAETIRKDKFIQNFVDNLAPFSSGIGSDFELDSDSESEDEYGWCLINSVDWDDLEYYRGDEGAKNIAKLLKFDTDVISLDLNSREIGPSGIRLICGALKHNQTLKSLALMDNDMGKAGLQVIVDLLGHNTAVTKLHLDPGNCFAWDKMAKIKYLTQVRNKTLIPHFVRRSALWLIFARRSPSNLDPLPDEIIQRIARHIWNSRKDVEWIQSVPQEDWSYEHDWVVKKKKKRNDACVVS